MKKKSTLQTALMLTLSILGGLLAVGSLFAQAPADSVLVVQSYHAAYPWSASIDAGIKKGFEGSNIKVETFYMDTKTKPDAAWKEEAGKLAEEKMKALKPKVVITCDDNAQEFFAKKFAGKADAPQFVFCGVNAEAKKYGYPADNVTGLLERAHVAETIDILLKIKPTAKKIAFLSDNSETSDAVFDYVKTIKTPITDIVFKQPVTFDEWQKTIKELQTSVDAIYIYMYHTVKKDAAATTSMDPKEVIKWTVDNNKLPIAAGLDFVIEDGALFGIAESGEEHGMISADIAKQIIKGKKAKDFPITTAKKGAIIFNAKTAQALKIDIPYDLLKNADKVIEK